MADVTALRPCIYMDFSIGGVPAGRITVELFSDKTPRTCENFRLLCTGVCGKVRLLDGSVHALHYKGSTFHRVISEFVIQGGDITRGNGTGGASIYGKNGYFEFPDENLGWRKIDREGLVCMGNRGRSTNTSQFLITLGPAEYLTGKHTLFGHVVSGMDVVKRIEGLEVDDRDKPINDVLIVNSGELKFRDNEPQFTSAKEVEIRGRKRSRSRERSKTRQPKIGDGAGSPGSRDQAPGREADGGAKRRVVKMSTSADRSGDRGVTDATPPAQPTTGRRSNSRARSQSRSHHHRRRRHHSESQSPPRRRYHKHRSRSHSRRGHRRRDLEYTRDEEAEQRIQREEREREMARFAGNPQLDSTDNQYGEREGRGDYGGQSGRMNGAGDKSKVKFKGRGSMKYREKNWGGGGRDGRLA